MGPCEYLGLANPLAKDMDACGKVVVRGSSSRVYTLSGTAPDLSRISCCRRSFSLARRARSSMISELFRVRVSSWRLSSVSRLEYLSRNSRSRAYSRRDEEILKMSNLKKEFF